MKLIQKPSIILLALAILLGVQACGNDAENIDDKIGLLKSHAETAYELGIAAVKRKMELQVATVWLMQKILITDPDPELQRIVDERVAQLVVNSPFGRIISPSAKRVLLPVEPGRGVQRFYNHLLATVGYPKDRAMAFLTDFLSTDESGYVLTHQLVAIEWANETGLELPAELLKKKQYLIERIMMEQQADPLFSDLYAERAAFVLLLGKPEPKEAMQWIQTIVTAQLKDGTWGALPRFMIYEGKKYDSGDDPVHTQVLALMVLRAFLDKY